MSENPAFNRVAYSPGEFASLFGKSQTWGYRQIYAGKVKAITEHGRILIPAKEVEKVLESAGIYNGRDTPRQQKTRTSKLSAENKSIWKRFLESRKGKAEAPKVGDRVSSKPGPKGRSGVSRHDVMKRLQKGHSEGGMSR